jgi:hypothetical protein
MIIQNPLFTQEIPEKGAAKGHIRFASTSRDPADVALLGLCANITASLLFEKLQAQGTNIILNLAKDTRVDVLARTEGDGINLLWIPKPMEQQQLTDTQERIRNKAFFIGKAAQVAQKDELTTPVLTTKEPDVEVDEEDEMIKHLHRVP